MGQELVLGPFEYSCSLLVNRGEILQSACMRYEYDSDLYVWPRCSERGKELQPLDLYKNELDVMRRFLGGYSGFCNFNYKCRKDTGQMCIIEVNARVGADLACDVPRPRAREMFEALDLLS